MPRLELLGPPRWIDDRGARPLRATRANCLVVRLASARGWTPREALLPLLWPESDEGAARTSLRQLLRSLPEDLADVVDRSGDALRYTGPCDIADATLLELGGAWSEALALHRGPFVDGFAPRAAPAFDDWSDGERARWAHAVGTLARRAFEAAVAAGATEAAVDAGRKWAEHDPLEAATASAVASGLRHLGAHLEAARAVERHREAARALGMPIDHGFSTDAPITLTPLASHMVGMSEVVLGRDNELTALDAWWAGPGRWCTVVAPGGMGKTTLVRTWSAARATAGIDIDAVDLNGIATPAEATRRALAALARGLRTNGSDEAFSKLVDDRTRLLVVDGAEDLETGGATLAAWLAAAPALRLLVTSRRPLAGAGERLQRLGALSVRRPATNEASVAAALVWARARVAVGRPFDDLPVPDVVQRAVERIGGWPLGLELLAGWAAWLGLERWLTALERDELDDGALEGMDDGARAIAASWRHLDGPHQDAVAALAGLARPFELDDARGVGVSIAVLGDLAATGWVTASDGAFTMHPLLVAHASDRRPERTAVATATHAHAVLEHHVDAYARTGRPPQGAWTRLHHLKAAWDHACTVGDLSALARAHRPLEQALNDARRLDDLAWCAQRARAAIDHATTGEATDGALRSRLALALELMDLRVPEGEGPSPATEARLARLEAAARSLDDVAAAARIAAYRSLAAFIGEGGLEHAERLAREALETLATTLHAASDRFVLAIAAQLANLVGLVAGRRGSESDARAWIERAERYALASGGPSLAAGWGHNLAYLDVQLGRYHAALARNDAGLDAGLRDGAPIALVERWHQRTLVLLRIGDATGARVAAEQLVACAATMHPRVRDEWWTNAWWFLAEAALLEGDTDAAERWLARCAPGVHVHRVQAEHALASGDVDRARRHVGAALAAPRSAEDDLVLAARLRCLEATILVAADDDAALAAVVDAIGRALALPYPPEHARAVRPATAWARAAGWTEMADRLSAALERAPFADAATRRAVAALHPVRSVASTAATRAAAHEGDTLARLDEALQACLHGLHRTRTRDLETTFDRRTTAAN